jgi:hypothetical protein
VHAVVARRVLGSGASGLVAIVAGSNPLASASIPISDRHVEFAESEAGARHSYDSRVVAGNPELAPRPRGARWPSYGSSRLVPSMTSWSLSRTSARELIVIPTYLYPGSSPRLQVALRDPRHRLEGPVIPLEQRFVAEGRYILSHGPKATSLVTQWSRATALHLRPRPHGKANSPNDARIVSRFGPTRRRDGVTGWGPQWHRPRASWRRQNLVRSSSPRAFPRRRGFGVRINERGTHQLKGLPRDWRLFALIG